MARYLTTHKIAGLIGVSERTVANWIDRGHLDAFRTPGGHRRVAPEGLRQFLVQRGIPIPDELDDGIRVLVVEDDPDVARVLKMHLTSEGANYVVTTIGDGVTALIHIGDRKPNVVILDILMPGMDGLEVCRKVRANADLKDVQVVFVTGRTDLDPASVKRDTGALDLLQKPVRGPELRAAVQRAVATRAVSPKPLPAR